MADSIWKQVTRQDPCPVCEKQGWCSVTEDGAWVACRRVAENAYKVKADKAGVPVYIHRLRDDAAGEPPLRRPRSTKPSAPSTNGKKVEVADADTLHRAYSLLLRELPLTEAHREALHRRGLTDKQIEDRGYRTYTFQARRGVASRLLDELGDRKLYDSVPGFIHGQRGPMLAGPEGLLVPCRDAAGRINALKVRRDSDVDGKAKYVYVSSTRQGGPSPGAPTHVPLGLAGVVEVIRLTEGELKADVATALSEVPTIGAPSAAGWRACLTALTTLGVKTVRVAIDADARRKSHVAIALRDCIAGLTDAGYVVELEQWAEVDGKGIDDLLLAGKTPEVLTGEDALAAVKVIATAAGVADPAESTAAAIERLGGVLAAGGTVALFRDAAMLSALARLKQTNPAEWAAVRETLRQAGVKMRDFDAAINPLLQKTVTKVRPAHYPAARYVTSAMGCICQLCPTSDGPVESPLCNFDARIVEQVVQDDGAEQRTVLAIEGTLMSGRHLPRIEVAATEFAAMQWPVTNWGTHAVVYAGTATRDHLRAGIQLLSGDVPRRTVYNHTGWRRIEGEWFYLHANGAIGPDGPAAGVVVSLPDALARYALPLPPVGADLAAAVRASLRLLELAPPRITFPLIASVYRAPLGQNDYSLHLCGGSGHFKSELAALAQQHYGAGLDARNFPASWSSTGNSLEGLAFSAKDTVLGADDFAPTGTASDVQRCHREADRVFRAKGNQSGRQRMRPDGTLRPGKPPRALIVSTGEDIPRGQSLRARLLAMEVGLGEVNKAQLTACQGDAREGHYAAAMAAYIQWLAPQYADLNAGLGREAARLRDAASADGQHARTPAIVGDLALGINHLLRFAVEIGAITEDERNTLWERGWEALLEAAGAQAGHQAANEPAQHFLRLISAAMASGRAHVADSRGGCPEDTPEECGWRYMPHGMTGEWQPQGRRIGWIDGEHIYLEPDASFAEAQRLAGEQNESLSVTGRTLHKRLRDRGVLASIDAGRETLTVRRTTEGKRRHVLHLHRDSLGESDRDESPNLDSGGDLLERDGQVDGRVPGRVPPATGGDPTSESDVPGDGNAAVVRLVGLSTEIEGDTCGADLPAEENWEEGEI